MTRQEAIKHLEEWKECISSAYRRQVIDMAIEALADRPKNMIHIDDVYRLIAGHSDYHGDSILSAFTCLVEGKDVKPIAPLDESADRPTGWIPVSERLPKEYAQYLAYFKTGECYVYWLEDSDWSRSIIELEEIVAWMPLPDPYKGGDTDG